VHSVTNLPERTRYQKTKDLVEKTKSDIKAVRFQTRRIDLFLALYYARQSAQDSTQQHPDIEPDL
jgi:hypothetical protein